MGADPEHLLDVLVDEDVLEVDPETDEVGTTESFELAREIYLDTYLEVPDEVFNETIADVFGLESAAEAAEHVDELGITREEFANYMALQSVLEGVGHDEVAAMANLVTEVGPASQVPAAVERLDDESYRSFLDENDRAVVTVWRRNCSPCDSLKAELDEVLAALPEGAAVGGVDGEDVIDFRDEFDVDAAPAILLFEGGELLEKLTGYTDPATLAETVDALYD